MIIEVWVVVMPGGDRPYTSAAPPNPELAEKWRAQGARIFKLQDTFPDNPEDGESSLLGRVPLVPDIGRPVNVRLPVNHQLDVVLEAVTHHEWLVIDAYGDQTVMLRHHVVYWWYDNDRYEMWRRALRQKKDPPEILLFSSALGGSVSAPEERHPAGVSRRLRWLGKHRGPVVVRASGEYAVEAILASVPELGTVNGDQLIINDVAVPLERS